MNYRATPGRDRPLHWRRRGQRPLGASSRRRVV